MSTDQESPEKSGPRRRPIVVILLIAILVLVIGYRKLQEPTVALPRTMTVYSFSIMEEVMDREILPAFRQLWHERTGEKLEFITLFAGSGAIVDEIIRQVPAHVAILSSELDAIRLRRSGVLLGQVWTSLPHAGVLSRSPMILLVRPGNPKQISSFLDLADEGVRIVHPDPLSSGGGVWSLLSAYGCGERVTRTKAEAADQMMAVWRNVVVEAPSARAGLFEFGKGRGDVTMTYEKEAIEQSEAGVRIGDVIYPECTLMSEHIVVKIPRNIDAKDAGVVDAFVEFLWTPPVQEKLVQHGFRSVDESLWEGDARFGAFETILTLKDLGGSERALSEIVDQTWGRRRLDSPAP